jgi:hypothetical protein
MLWEPFKATAPSRTAVVYLETNLSAALSVHHTDVGNSTLNQFGICFQLRIEHLRPRIILFFGSNGAMNPPRYWQRRKECSAILATALLTLHDDGYSGSSKRMGKFSSAFEKADAKWRLSLQRDEFNSRIGNSFLSKGRTDFSENLRTTLFNNDQSNETTVLLARSISQDSTFKRN